MTEVASFEAHARSIESATTRALAVAAGQGAEFDAIVFHAGSLATYHGDDLEVPFRGHPHFLRFAPIDGPDHFLLHRPGERACLIRNTASDFWTAPPSPIEDEVANAIEVVDSKDPLATLRDMRASESCAFIGADVECARALGIEAAAVEPARLVAALDWERGFKTPYEVECIREAQRVAGLGHRALLHALSEHVSEYELHLAYLAATRQLEAALPYPSIIAWDEASAVLHYQRRRTQPPNTGRTFLVDAGATHRGYASDVTRTYSLGAPGFDALLDGMESLQQGLVDRVGPGVDFVALHRAAEVEIATLLREVGLVRASVEEARARGILFAFFPHGLGHHLGLQVHDVGGRQTDANGSLREAPEDCPHLRTTRELAPGHVVTIEPGLYFIPSLLDPLREGATRALVAWDEVDRLLPRGGIRIEDDVHVSETGHENLTRPFVPGHRGDR